MSLIPPMFDPSSAVAAAQSGSRASRAGTPTPSNSAVSRAHAQRQALEAIYPDMCLEGEPRNLAEAMGRRREASPYTPHTEPAFDHFSFQRWLDRTEIDPDLRVVVVEWSWQLAQTHMSQEHQIRADSEARQINLREGPYGAGVSEYPGIEPQPLRKRGEWTRDLLMGAVDYGIGLGRGLVRIGRYAAATSEGAAGPVVTGSFDWDFATLRELADEERAFGAAIVNALRNPVDTIGTVVTGYAALSQAAAGLTADEREQVKELAGEQLVGFVQRQLGKKLGKAIVLTVVVDRLTDRLTALVTNELVKKGITKAKGGALMVLSVLGMIDEAASSSRDLRAKHPLVYELLEKRDLHMLWFLVDDHAAEIDAAIRDQIGLISSPE